MTSIVSGYEALEVFFGILNNIHCNMVAFGSFVFGPCLCFVFGGFADFASYTIVIMMHTYFMPDVTRTKAAYIDMKQTEFSASSYNKFLYNQVLITFIIFLKLSKCFSVAFGSHSTFLLIRHIWHYRKVPDYLV